MTAQGSEAEFEVDEPGALEEFREQGGDHETNNESEEDIVGDHPAVGCETRQAAVEKHNRNFDQANCHPEDYYADEPKLD